MKLTVIGCSDAFNSGGRLQSCYHVAAAQTSFLIDCGANTLMGLAREGIDPNGIPLIFISHLHGDHFAGLVWWVIHANHVSGRTAPLTIAGPRGLEQRFTAAAEALFPGSSKTPRKYELAFVEYQGTGTETIGGIAVTPFEVSHPSGAPPYALRFEAAGKTLAFSGDTGWVESLVAAASGADLFICECFGFDKDQRHHLNWRTIENSLERLDVGLMLLTHLGPEMLAARAMIRNERVRLAEDGLKLTL